MDLYAKIAEQEEFSPADAKELREVLQNKALLRAFGVLSLSMNQRAMSMLGMPLETEEGRAAALRVQGEVRGIHNLFSQLAALADEQGDEK